MASEEAKGDEGLLGEKPKDATAPPAAPAKPERPRYQTRVIYETDD